MALKCTIIKDKKDSNKSITKYYSNTNKYIIQRETGKKYITAIDSSNIYTYYESTESIPVINNDKYTTR